MTVDLLENTHRAKLHTLFINPSSVDCGDVYEHDDNSLSSRRNPRIIPLLLDDERGWDVRISLPRHVVCGLCFEITAKDGFVWHLSVFAIVVSGSESRLNLFQ